MKKYIIRYISICFIIGALFFIFPNMRVAAVTYETIKAVADDLGVDSVFAVYNRDGADYLYEIKLSSGNLKAGKSDGPDAHRTEGKTYTRYIDGKEIGIVVKTKYENIFDAVTGENIYIDDLAKQEIDWELTTKLETLETFKLSLLEAVDDDIRNGIIEYIGRVTNESETEAEIGVGDLGGLYENTRGYFVLNSKVHGKMILITESVTKSNKVTLRYGARTNSDGDKVQDTLFATIKWIVDPIGTKPKDAIDSVKKQTSQKLINMLYQISFNIYSFDLSSEIRLSDLIPTGNFDNDIINNSKVRKVFNYFLHPLMMSDSGEWLEKGFTVEDLKYAEKNIKLNENGKVDVNPYFHEFFTKISKGVYAGIVRLPETVRVSGGLTQKTNPSNPEEKWTPYNAITTLFPVAMIGGVKITDETVNYINIKRKMNLENYLFNNRTTNQEELKEEFASLEDAKKANPGSTIKEQEGKYYIEQYDYILKNLDNEFIGENTSDFGSIGFMIDLAYNIVYKGSSISNMVEMGDFKKYNMQLDYVIMTSKQFTNADGKPEERGIAILAYFAESFKAKSDADLVLRNGEEEDSLGVPMGKDGNIVTIPKTVTGGSNLTEDILSSIKYWDVTVPTGRFIAVDSLVNFTPFAVNQLFFYHNAVGYNTKSYYYVENKSDDGGAVKNGEFYLKNRNELTAGEVLEFNIGFSDAIGPYIIIGKDYLSETNFNNWLDTVDAKKYYDSKGISTETVKTLMRGLFNTSRELTPEQLRRIQEIRKNLSKLKENKIYHFINIVLNLFGILLVLYALALLACFYIDVVNPFGFEVSTLKFITGGGLQAVGNQQDYEHAVLSTPKGQRMKYITHWGIWKKWALTTVLAIVFLSSNTLLTWVIDLYVLIISWFGR